MPIFRLEHNHFSSVHPKIESWIWGVQFCPESLFRCQQGLYLMICVIEARASCSFKITFLIYSQQWHIFYKARCVIMILWSIRISACFDKQFFIMENTTQVEILRNCGLFNWNFDPEFVYVQFDLQHGRIYLCVLFSQTVNKQICTHTKNPRMDSWMKTWESIVTLWIKLQIFKLISLIA